MGESTTKVLETADESEPSSLACYATERLNVTVRIAIVIVTDAIVFACWMGMAWLTHIVATFVQQKGVNEFCATAFMWVSSTSTLALALIYIAADIHREFRRLFPAKRSRRRRRATK